MFIDRRRRGPDRFLWWKSILLVGGIAIALVGMRLENRALVSLAILLVLIGFMLRFVRTGDARRGEAGEEP